MDSAGGRETADFGDFWAEISKTFYFFVKIEQVMWFLLYRAGKFDSFLILFE